jgi:hypothetical protein
LQPPTCVTQLGGQVQQHGHLHARHNARHGGCINEVAQDVELGKVLWQRVKRGIQGAC